MGRLTIFAKGNLDVRDSLIAFRIGGDVKWNGVNETVRPRFPDTTVRVRHEVFSRSDALLAANGSVPPRLLEWRPPLGPFSIENQFSTALFEAAYDIVVLSIQSDVMTSLARHRRDGFLFHPYNRETWPAEDKHRLSQDFERSAMLDVETSMANFDRIIERIRARSSAPILVYNVSAVVPGELVHSHRGVEGALSTRIRQFNLGLVALSQRTGISIVDVDSIVARAGADRVKLDPIHLTAEGCRLVAEEVTRVLDDLGCFAPAGATQ